jgi:hypothetical protein
MRLLTALLVAASVTPAAGAQTAITPVSNHGGYCIDAQPNPNTNATANACTRNGNFFTAEQAAGVFAVKNYDQLVAINAALRELIGKQNEVVASVRGMDSTSRAMQVVLNSQLIEFSKVVREAITDRFKVLPVVLTQDKAFRDALEALKTEILTIVDEKVAAVTKTQKPNP